MTVTAKNTADRLHPDRDVSDAEGVYRLTALPVGIYDVTAELPGFSKVENKGIVVNVGQTLDVNMTLKVASVAETVNVTGETPLIETTSSSVGGVVDVERIESLPLNGRQFANLAATIPGVGLGFHTDPTKSTQYSPQINGGNGRNVNYQIDGGDNNDDTVGGLLQLFPLEAIQEFNFQYRSASRPSTAAATAACMNIVTKSGTNNCQRQLLRALPRQVDERADRDREAERRRQAGLPPLPVRRQLRRPDREGQGALLRRGRADAAGHDAGGQHARACSRTRTASSPTPYRENLFTGKVTANLNAGAVPVGALRPQHQLAAVRRRRRSSTLDNWGDSTNKFNSINLNHNWVLGGVEAERVHLPVRRLRATTSRRAASTPQRDVPERRDDRRRTPTRRRRPSSRSTSSATTSRGT